MSMKKKILTNLAFLSKPWATSQCTHLALPKKLLFTPLINSKLAYEELPQTLWSLDKYNMYYSPVKYSRHAHRETQMINSMRELHHSPLNQRKTYNLGATSDSSPAYNSISNTTPYHTSNFHCTEQQTYYSSLT